MLLAGVGRSVDRLQSKMAINQRTRRWLAGNPDQESWARAWRLPKNGYLENTRLRPCNKSIVTGSKPTGVRWIDDRLSWSRLH